MPVSITIDKFDEPGTYDHKRGGLMSAVSHPRWRGFLIVAIVVALLFVGAATADAAAPPKPKDPRKVYLALGDSLAFGYQKAKVIANLPNPSPTLFNTGYVNVFQFGSTLI
jgi:hypothetical protein